MRDPRIILAEGRAMDPSGSMTVDYLLHIVYLRGYYQKGYEK